MHVVMIASAPYFSGGEQYLLDVAAALRARGHVVTVAANRRLASELRQRGIEAKVLPLGPKLSGRNIIQVVLFPLWWLYLTTWLATLHLRRNVGVVHCQYKKEQVLVSLAAAFLGIRLVWTEHGPLPGFMAGKRWLIAVYRILSALPERIIAVSEATRWDLIAHGLDGNKIVTIPNGILTAPPAGPPPRGLARIFSAGRLIAGKGHALVIEAMPYVVERVPEATLAIAGDGPLASELNRLSERLHLKDKVTLLGHIPREEVRRQIEASSLVVVPSLASVGGEGLPYVILEAMERGRPVVATRSGGIPDVVEDGKTGLLVERCTPQALAGAILSLLEDPDRAAELGREARRAIERKFSFAAMIDATEKVLTGVD